MSKKKYIELEFADKFKKDQKQEVCHESAELIIEYKKYLSSTKETDPLTYSDWRIKNKK